MLFTLGRSPHLPLVWLMYYHEQLLSGSKGYEDQYAMRFWDVFTALQHSLITNYSAAVSLLWILALQLYFQNSLPVVLLSRGIRFSQALIITQQKAVLKSQIETHGKKKKRERDDM